MNLTNLPTEGIEVIRFTDNDTIERGADNVEKIVPHADTNTFWCLDERDNLVMVIDAEHIMMVYYEEKA